MPLSPTKLKIHIGASGLSHSEVARRAQMHQPSIPAFLAGKRNPTIAVLDRLAKALGCRAGDLLD